MMRQLQPNIVINNRSSLPGDYDTPEQRIGDFNRARPWETCMTLGTQWAYKPNDTQKNLKDCIDTLVKCAGGDGNLLLNTGPMPDGRMVPGDVARFLEIGNWMQDYGESIYGTRGGPIKPTGFVASTCKGNIMYIHMLQAQFLGGEVQLPAMSRNVVSARVFPTGEPVGVTPNASGTLIAVASPYWQSLDTVVELTMDGAAFDITPFNISTNSLTTGKPATASNVYQNQVSTYGPAKAVDGDFATRWATDGGRTADWLEVDLQAPTTFNSAILSEGFDRARSWRIEYLDGATWKTAYTGTLIGSYLAVNFPAVTAQRVRLNYLQATNGPTVWEFQLFNK